MTTPSRGVEPALFRQMLGRFATGVTVLTTRSPRGGPIGMTANSLSSVSLQPPLVLVAVERIHDMHGAMEAATHFIFNVLAEDQEALSRRFAAADVPPGRFDGVGYTESKHGIAVLDGVLAHIECEKHATVPAGDHTVFIGLVTGGAVSERRPLLYYRGGYGASRP